jgi:hypothetical protein
MSSSWTHFTLDRRSAMYWRVTFDHLRSTRLQPGRFSRVVSAPAQQARWARLQALGLNTDSDLERHLGPRVLESAPNPAVAQT